MDEFRMSDFYDASYDLIKDWRVKRKLEELYTLILSHEELQDLLSHVSDLEKRVKTLEAGIREKETS